MSSCNITGCIPCGQSRVESRTPYLYEVHTTRCRGAGMLIFTRVRCRERVRCPQLWRRATYATSTCLCVNVKKKKKIIRPVTIRRRRKISCSFEYYKQQGGRTTTTKRRNVTPHPLHAALVSVTHIVGLSDRFDIRQNQQPLSPPGHHTAALGRSP